jgi:hypothetical protein
MENEKTITISVKALQELATFNRGEQERYTAMGLFSTANWCEGKARAYEMLIEHYSH